MILTVCSNFWHRLRFSLATPVLIFTYSAAQSQTEPYVPLQISGTAIQNHDGDTFRIQTQERGLLVVRFSGSDTPETGQAYWRTARNILRHLLSGQETTVHCYKRDHHGRDVCHVTIGTTDIAVGMVRRGMAWYAFQYANELTESQRLNYRAAEHIAQEKRIGLWSMPNPQPPWECRKLRKQRINCR